MLVLVGVIMVLAPPGRQGHAFSHERVLHADAVAAMTSHHRQFIRPNAEIGGNHRTRPS